MKKYLLLLLFFLGACHENYTPRPRGYMRIDYPQKSYVRFQNDAPFSFDYPGYAQVIPDDSQNAEKYWYNIFFPCFDGTIYLSYKKVDNNLSGFIQDSRKLAYKHSIKAESIEEQVINKKDSDVYGILYNLSGNTASSLQFFLTDSTHHFIRGSLYFNSTPNKDSLAPVVNFIKEDVLMMIQNFSWTENQSMK